jgi:hypothetical protein
MHELYYDHFRKMALTKNHILILISRADIIITLSYLYSFMLYHNFIVSIMCYQFLDERVHSNRWPIPSRPMLPSEVNVELHNRKLWQQFHAETTEMIITKSGR